MHYNTSEKNNLSWVSQQKFGDGYIIECFSLKSLKHIGHIYLFNYILKIKMYYSLKLYLLS